MKKILLFLVFVSSTLIVKAQDNELVIGESAKTKTAFVTFRTDKNGNRISNSYSGKVVIPKKSPSGYPVTMINHETFEGCTKLTSVTIPNTVKLIDYGAFCIWMR